LISIALGACLLSINKGENNRKAAASSQHQSLCLCVQFVSSSRLFVSFGSGDVPVTFRRPQLIGKSNNGDGLHDLLAVLQCRRWDQPCQCHAKARKGKKCALQGCTEDLRLPRQTGNHDGIKRQA
jgi:hypothetical protein